LCRAGLSGKNKNYLYPFVGGARRSSSGGPALCDECERTSQLITIFMLVGALAMIGLVLSGTLQMSRLPVAQVATK
jgi:hypothetical protein